uniref:PUM-HD domain-containing protein n=1 Tax=Trichuris muris TaxID=70415 RepID=A0A5S6QMA3_TRIMR
MDPFVFLLVYIYAIMRIMFAFNLTSGGLPYDDSLTQTAANVLHDMLRKRNGAKHFVRAFVSMNEKYWVHGMYQLAGQFVARLQCAEETSPLCYRRVLEECLHVFKTNGTRHVVRVLEECLDVSRTNGTRHVVKSGCGVIIAEIYKSPLKGHLEPIGVGNLFAAAGRLDAYKTIRGPDGMVSRAGGSPSLVHTIEEGDEFFQTKDPFVHLLMYIYVSIHIMFAFSLTSGGLPYDDLLVRTAVSVLHEV